MNDDIASSFKFPAVGRKKITAAFDGGRLTSDGGVLLLAQAERAMGIASAWRLVLPIRAIQRG
jgi:hypothetical protein